MSKAKTRECLMIKKMTYRPINWSIYRENYYCENCQKEIDKDDKYCRHCGSKFTDEKTEYDITPKELLQKMLANKYDEETADKIINNLNNINLEIQKQNGIAKIKIGDKVKCLNCGEPISLDGKTFIFNSEAEYIYCPYCKAKIDVQYYHLHGEKVK